MAWKKAPEWLIEAFADLDLEDPAVERRKMFGYPCAFANRNMFIGLHQDSLILRLPETDRERFLAEHDSEIFAPFPGRPMREYVVVPHEFIHDRKALDPWIELSITYASSLEPKRKKRASRK